MKVKLWPDKYYFNSYDYEQKYFKWKYGIKAFIMSDYTEDKWDKLVVGFLDTFVQPICSFLNLFIREDKKTKVKIHDYDIWNLDSTLAYIILPALKKFKERIDDETKVSGAPYVDNEDVPEELHRPDNINEYDLDDNHFKRWDYVLNEMIFAFESINTHWEEQFHSGKLDIVFVPVDKDGNEVDEEGAEFFRMDETKKSTHKIDKEGLETYQARITNGLKLFGKYYQGLWI